MGACKLRAKRGRLTLTLWFKVLFGFFTGLGAVLPAFAQDRAVFIADQMIIQEDGRLYALGDVEARYQSMRVTAASMVYDRATDMLTLQGPILYDDGAGSVILANFAQLSDGMQSGLLRSARLILDQQLQLSASAAQSLAGRYTTLQNVAASSCKICQTNATPLWEIRARSVVHDKQTQQIYFEGAQFRLGGVPLVYLPQLRMPDPTLKRATGFLPPKLEASTSRGFGVKIPYFIALGAHRDVTLSPYIRSENERGFDLRYRQAFAAGDIEVNASLSNDGDLNDPLRGYVLASGRFDLRNGYKLALRAETVSDANFFRGYGLEERDRLVTSATIDRTARDTYDFARLQGFHSIRSDDVNATQPSTMAEFNRQQRISMGDWGDLGLSYHSHARLRASQNPLDGDDPDDFADGRDVTGFGMGATWNKTAVTEQGVLLNFALAARMDSYAVRQDAVYAGDYTRSHLAFAADARFPMVKTGPQGAQHLIEPMAQIVLAPNTPTRLFNEDSALVEFDEGNLFAINRFPGSDRIEAGSRVNMGLRYAYHDAEGRRGQVLLGKVISDLDQAQFSAASGLGQKSSDWLVAGQLDMNKRQSITLRSLIAPDTARLRKLELRSAYSGKSGEIAVGYLFAPADADEGRSADISEISLSARQQLSAQWRANIAARYDEQTNKLSRAGLGLEWRNECMRVDLSLSRTFTSSANVRPNTDFGLSVAFLGIGGQAAGPSGQCQG